MKKKQKFDDNLVEILCGSLIVCLNNFNSGTKLEKIFVLLGLVILIIGIVRTIMKCNDKDRKGMKIFLIISCLIAVAVLFGLLYRFIFD